MREEKVNARRAAERALANDESEDASFEIDEEGSDQPAE